MLRAQAQLTPSNCPRQSVMRVERSGVAEQSIAGQIQTRRNPGRPSVIGMVSHHQSAMGGPDLVGSGIFAHAKNGAGLCLAQRGGRSIIGGGPLRLPRPPGSSGVTAPNQECPPQPMQLHASQHPRRQPGRDRQKPCQPPGQNQPDPGQDQTSHHQPKQHLRKGARSGAGKPAEAEQRQHDNGGHDQQLHQHAFRTVPWGNSRPDPEYHLYPRTAPTPSSPSMIGRICRSPGFSRHRTDMPRCPNRVPHSPRMAG